MPEYFLNVTDSYFYIPTAIQEDVTATYLADGKKDMLSVLYSNESIPSYVSDSNIDPYNVAVNRDDTYDEDKDTTAIKILISEGTQPLLSADPGDLVWLKCHGGNPYRALIRGVAEKFPGFGFTGVSDPDPDVARELVVSND